VTETTNTLQQLFALVRDFETAMLTTLTGSGAFHGRPMHIAAADGEGTITFAVSIDDAVVAEFTEHHRAAVTLQSATVFIALNGTLRLNTSEERIAQLWTDAWRTWFIDGPGDPALRLLDFDLENGEYWISAAESAIEGLVDAGRALLRGEETHGPATITHARVDLAERS
jgi:general stress protein 26